LGGPYKAPRCRLGKPLYDLIAGDLVVRAISDAPISWPIGRAGAAGKGRPILCGDLLRAVKLESNAAVMTNWGVSRWTVERWRRALGVPRMNPGTLALWRAMTPAKVQRPDVVIKARAGSRRRAKKGSE